MRLKCRMVTEVDFSSEDLHKPEPLIKPSLIKYNNGSHTPYLICTNTLVAIFMQGKESKIIEQYDLLDAERSEGESSPSSS